MTKNSDSSLVDVWKRELGELSTRSFAHRFAASKDLVLRLDIVRKLDKLQGHVSSLSFNEAGDVLVSGFEDMRIILWDWETGHKKLSFHSGHHKYVYQTKIMPYTDDRCIVTCAADGQVRRSQILECGEVETKLLTQKYPGLRHKLAVEPGSPHCLYTCCEDGVIQHKVNYVVPILLSAIAIDSRNPNLLAVGGSDQFARLYDVRRYKWDVSSEFDCRVNLFCPPCLIDYKHVGITGLAFSDQSELLVSYSHESIYLFPRDIGLGPDPTLTTQVFGGSDVGDMIPDGHSSSYISKVDANIIDFAQAYKGHRNCMAMQDVNFLGPKCEYVMSGSDCGRIFIWKKYGGELIRVIEAGKHIVHCIGSHSHATVLASSGIEHGINIWIPKAMDRAILPSIFRKVGDDDKCEHYRYVNGYYSDEDEDSNDNNEEDDDSYNDDTDSDDEDEFSV